MPYVWIFGISYLTVFCCAFYFMSRKMAHAADNMRNMGMEQEQIDDLYKSMGARTLVTLVWATFFSGSILAAVISGIYWFTA